MPCSLQDFINSSPTQDWTQVTAVKPPSPKHWPSRESLLFLFWSHSQHRMILRSKPGLLDLVTLGFLVILYLESEVTVLSVMSDSMILWTVARQASLSLEFSRQEYQGGLRFPSPGDLPDPGIEPGSPALQANSLPSKPQGSPLFGS